jgi:hypothetical protein
MHLPGLLFRSRARRILTAVLGVCVLLVMGAAPVAAFDPDLFELEPTPTPRPTPAPEIVTRPRPVPPRDPQSGAAPTPAPQPDPSRGLDVSWPQCDDVLPESFGFAIVGVNRGRTYSENDCLVDQLEWAGEDADVYLNTANPGPDHSVFWPAGQTEPIDCDSSDDDSRECAYLYGWNAAADGYARVLAAFSELGWADDNAQRVPGDRTWWLDVETANTWRLDHSLNVAALHGAVDFLESMDVAEVGFYSTPLLWWRVTFGTDDFDDHPAWHAGAHSHAGAEELCERDTGFTGGELRMVQWVEDGLDRNFRCP